MKKMNFKMQLSYFLVILSIALFAKLSAEAHGDNIPGPNGGHIRMPGPFHTEVLQLNDGFKIYLLDIDFKNPIVKNSYVKASVQKGNQITKLNCSIQENYFFCLFKKTNEMAKLLIDSKRDVITGNEANYLLPLK